MLRTLESLNGRATAVSVVKNKLVHAMTAWSVTENSAANAWNLNFSSGNLNNNNKNNTNSVRAVCALEETEIDGWVDAFFNCIEKKRTAPQCDRYRAQYEEDLLHLAAEVKTRTYQPSKSTCFIVTRPRLREIFAAAFRDRIAQHWVIMRLNPILEERFVAQGNVSFNCRKGLGTLRAVERLKSEIEAVSDNYAIDAYIGKFDIKSFFMSISKSIMLRLLIPFIKEHYKGNDIDTLLYLVEVIIMHCPQKLCVRKSPPTLWERLPHNKSLFYADDDTGLAIGNITSQILANFYLSFFDEYILSECEKYGARYVRFVDDWVVVCRDKMFIIDLHKKASLWLRKHLSLELHHDKFYLQHASKGVKFVGQVIKPNRRYTSRATITGFHESVLKTEAICRAIICGGTTIQRVRWLNRYVSSVNSYLGFLCHTASYNVRRKLLDRQIYLWRCCYVRAGYLVVGIKNYYKFSSYLIALDYERSSMEQWRKASKSNRVSRTWKTSVRDTRRARK